MWAGMMVWMAVFWAGILVLAFALASRLFPTGPGASRSAAHYILHARFARGELTAEQYRQMRQEIAPEPRWGVGRFTPPILALILGVLILVVFAVGFGMFGGWAGPRLPGGTGGWPLWIPRMWGR